MQVTKSPNMLRKSDTNTRNVSYQKMSEQQSKVGHSYQKTPHNPHENYFDNQSRAAALNYSGQSDSKSISHPEHKNQIYSGQSSEAGRLVYHQGRPPVSQATPGSGVI